MADPPPAEPGPDGPDRPPAGGLPDDDVRDLIARLDGLLGRLEQATGPDAETAVRAVEGLTLLYGTALARVVALAGGTPAVVSSLAGDELLHHLLALHGVHPHPAEDRIRRALDEVRPQLRARGGDVELAGVEDGVALLRWSGAGPGGGCSAAAVERAVGDAVVAAAPELRGVRALSAPGERRPAAVIPVDALLRRPAAPTASGGETP